MTEIQAGGPLEVFGIGATSEQAYRLLLRRPGCTAAEVAHQLGRASGEAEDLVMPLVERGLVRRSGDGLVADAPEFALGRLLSAQARRVVEVEDAMTAARAEIHNYVAEYLAGQGADWHPVSLDVIPAGELSDVMETLTSNSTGEMLFLRPDQWHLPQGKGMDTAVTLEMASGRPSRVLYPAKVIETSPDSVTSRARAGERIRVLPSLPTRMAIFGEDAAILPEIWGSTTGNRLLIRQQAVIAACIALFDQLWAGAVTVPGLGAGYDASRRQLLELLSRGVKDEHIARSLGMSLRTVRRRIATLMAELGVDSRFQAGVEAVRRGWL